MNKEQIESLAVRWQHRLGLDRQRIAFQFVDECPHEEACLAETSAKLNYDQATVRFLSRSTRVVVGS